YSLLRSTEDLFGVPHLAYAANDGLKPFEEDVFNRPEGPPAVKPPAAYPRPRVAVKGVPRHGCVRKAFRVKINATAKHLKRVNVMVDRKNIASRRKKIFRIRVKTAKLRPGKHQVTARASDRKGRAA